MDFNVCILDGIIIIKTNTMNFVFHARNIVKSINVQ